GKRWRNPATSAGLVAELIHYLSYSNVEELACKNSINWEIGEDAGMFRVFSLHPAAQLHVLAGAVAGKRRKILVEVRLIIELRLMRDQRQIHGPCQINQAQGVRKSIEAGHFPWRDAHE